MHCWRRVEAGRVRVTWSGGPPVRACRCSDWPDGLAHDTVNPVEKEGGSDVVATRGKVHAGVLRPSPKVPSLVF